jgi:hypothetical protein
MQKEEKNVGYSDFDPPFWIEPPFLTDLTKYALDLCC